MASLGGLTPRLTDASAVLIDTRTDLHQAAVIDSIGRHLATEAFRTTRPDRKARRDNGKSDPVDAYAAATAVLAGRAGGTPKARNGIVEAIRTPIVTAPSAVRDRLRGLSTSALVDTLARSRPAGELPAHPGIHGPTHRRRHDQEGRDPLPETVRRPRDLPPPTSCDRTTEPLLQTA